MVFVNPVIALDMSLIKENSFSINVIIELLSMVAHFADSKDSFDILCISFDCEINSLTSCSMFWIS